MSQTDLTVESVYADRELSLRTKTSEEEESPETLTSEPQELEEEDEEEYEDGNGDENKELFFSCYLLVSHSPQYKGCTYIGYTVDPRRRLRQHNGEIGSGPWTTKHKRPWEMILCIHGFPSKVSALRFEWEWQLRDLRLRSRREAVMTSFEFLYGVANTIKLAYTMLTLRPWKRLNLTVNYLSRTHTKHATECPSLPQNMKVLILPMDDLPCYVKGRESVPWENRGMSMTAQFRAIQPRPSVLSYVEDNLLGRRRLVEFQKAGYNIKFSSPLDNVPYSTSLEKEQIEENVFRNRLTFFASAKVSLSFLPPELPEIAFAGASNVGKSSLLKSLTRQWGSLRASDKPGLTQTIKFFQLGSKILVDLPGYGFASGKEEVKDGLEKIVKEYVATRASLTRVCLLIETKWGMKPRDHELIELMERAETKYQIVLTKTDVVSPINVARWAVQVEEALKGYKSSVQPVMMVSSKSGAGIRNSRAVLAKIGRFTKL